MAVITAEAVTGGVDTQRPSCGHFVTDDGTAVLESNYFPVAGAWFSVSLYVSALPTGDTAQVTFGLVGFDPAYAHALFLCSDRYTQARIVSKALLSGTATLTTENAHNYQVDETVLIDGVDGTFDGVYTITGIPTQNTFTVANGAGDVSDTASGGISTTRQTLPLSGGSATDGFLHLRGLVRAPTDVAEMCFRLEVQGASEIWLDNVLVDPHEGQYGYFDGDSVESLPDDFHWMNGQTNGHFSLWYNNFNNAHHRLTSEWDPVDQMYKPGLVEEWAPTGSNIVDHWDAVTSFTPRNWSGDAYYPLAQTDGTAVSVIDNRMNFQYIPCPAPLA